MTHGRVGVNIYRTYAVPTANGPSETTILIIIFHSRPSELWPAAVAVAISQAWQIIPGADLARTTDYRLQSDGCSVPDPVQWDRV